MTIEFKICRNKLTAENEKCIAQSPITHIHAWLIRCMLLTLKLHVGVHARFSRLLRVFVVLFSHFKYETHQFFSLVRFFFTSLFSCCYREKKQREREKKEKRKNKRKRCGKWLNFFSACSYGILILLNFEFKQIINIAK